jgi:chromosomal replication initiator protein
MPPAASKNLTLPPEANAAPPDLWAQCQQELARTLPVQQFNTWIKPLVGQFDPNQMKLTVYVANRFKLDWVRTQYFNQITGLCQLITGDEIKLELAIAARVEPARYSQPASNPSPTPSTVATNVATAGRKTSASRTKASIATSISGAIDGNASNGTNSANGSNHNGNSGAGYQNATVHSSNTMTSVFDAIEAASFDGDLPSDEEPVATVIHKNRLNPQLSFDNLIEGTANRMARAAGLHVSSTLGQLYNPLFIYGGVGVGKTHLMHAIGNRVLDDNPNANILYIHAEQFVSDVVRAYQRKTFQQFKERYHSLDLLLIDDVQFLAGKDRTQEEFFNAFEALLAKKSHLVMTSDTYPKGLVDMHQRLVSRFEAGLTVGIEPPELEMRVAIMIQKARAENTEMPEDVAFFVAKNVRSNVRELEGALRKILAYSRFNQKEITIGLAKEALRDLLSIQNRQISVENIQKTVADFYKIKIADMYSKKRPASIAKPRQIAMYLAKELTQKSLPEIGQLFGGRDHTTVLYAVRKISAERANVSELNQALHVLEQTLKG